MFLSGQALYASIERGEIASPAAVEAALLDAQLQASGDDPQ
jgi:hypothetical protein